MKYAEPNAYEQESRRELQAAATEFLGDVPLQPAPLVDLLEDEPLEVELATTLAVPVFASFLSADSRNC